MGWVYLESFWFFCPTLNDVFEGRQPFECLQSSCVVVSVDEVLEVRAKSGVIFVVVALHGGFFQRPVHPLNLPVGPGMVWFGQPVFDPMLGTDPIKEMPHQGGKVAVGPSR